MFLQCSEIKWKKDPLQSKLKLGATRRHFGGTKVWTEDGRIESVWEQKVKFREVGSVTEEKEIKECEGITGRCVCVCLYSQKQKKKQQCGGEVNKTPWNNESADYSSKGNSRTLRCRHRKEETACFLSYLLFTRQVCWGWRQQQSSTGGNTRRRKQELNEWKHTDCCLYDDSFMWFFTISAAQSDLCGLFLHEGICQALINYYKWYI